MQSYGCFESTLMWVLYLRLIELPNFFLTRINVRTNDPVSAVMEVYAENQTLLKTSSLPEPIVLDDSKGTIQLATTLDDHTLKNIKARALLTDDQKISPMSDPIEASLGLGEVRSTDTSGMK